MEVYMNTEYKLGSARWVKWIWENNPHLKAGEKIYACLHHVEYMKLLNICIKYNLPLKD